MPWRALKMDVTTQMENFRNMQQSSQVTIPAQPKASFQKIAGTGAAMIFLMAIIYKAMSSTVDYPEESGVTDKPCTKPPKKSEKNSQNDEDEDEAAKQRKKVMSEMGRKGGQASKRGKTKKEKSESEVST